MIVGGVTVNTVVRDSLDTRMSDGDPETVVRELLSESALCTLATASPEGKPEAATIQFVADDDLNCYFETFPSYRKYDNLTANPRASVVVTDPPRTVQMDGETSELTGVAADRARERLVAAHGSGTGYLDDPAVCFFRFRPTWIRVLLDAEYPPTYAMVRGEGETDLHP